MKKFITIALLIDLAAFVALWLVSPRTAKSVATIYDAKNVPGSSCRAVKTSYGFADGATPGTARSTWATTNNGFISSGITQLLAPPAWSNGVVPGTGDWQASCPLVEDNPANATGMNSVTVDVEHNSASSNLNVSCYLEQCTDVMANGAHGCCLGPAATATSGQLLTVKDFSLSLTATPYTSCGEGVHPYVYAAVRCDLDVGTSVLGVRYNHVGGNNGDW